MRRRRYFFLFLIFFVLLFSSSKIPKTYTPDAYSGPTRKPAQSWVYMDLIIADYNTGIPEGHVSYNLQKSSGVTSADMPLLIQKQLSGDSGKIAISYGMNNALIFAGSLVQNGSGTISTPSSLDTNMAENNTGLAMPTYFQFLKTDSGSVNQKIKRKAEQTWTHISKMQILSAYYNVNFKTAFFLYEPEMSSDDMKNAKWIVLLERDAEIW